MIDAQTSIQDFLSAAAAKQPTPGGGAVAALAGALAASMGEMVLQYSVAKKDLLPFSDQNQEALDQLAGARATLVRLMVEDQAAYQSFSDAKKRGAPADEMKAIVEACIGVPMSIGVTALDVLKIANRVASTSNKWLLSDLAVCGELATATVRCAIHNVRVNLPEAAEPDRDRNEVECASLLNNAVEEVKRLMTSIRAAK